MPFSLFHTLQAKQFVHTVELNPPASHNPNDALAEVAALPQEIDAIDITNCAFSKVRLSPVALGHLIQERLGKEVIINYTCRDRNIIAAKSDLLGALALGITNVLCMTGDDPKVGDHPEATGVFDLDTCSLIRLCKELKIERCASTRASTRENSSFARGARSTSSARSLGTAQHDVCDACFTVAATATVETDDLNRQKLQAKRSAGADFFITQPVYCLEDVENAAKLQEEVGKPFILGLLPFKSAGMAKRLASVPGIHVPGELLRMIEDIPQEDFPAFSVESLLPIAERARALLSGLHIMPIGEVWKVNALLQPSFAPKS